MVDVEDLVARARVAPREVRLTCERHLVDQTLAPATRAGLLLALGWAAFTQADTVAAADALAGAQQFRGHGPSVVDPAELLRLESAVLIERGQTAIAAERIEKLLEEQAGGNRSRLWSGLGAAHSASGGYHEAIDCYDQALDEARHFDDRFSELLVLNNRAVAFLELGKFDEAATDLTFVREASTDDEFAHLYAISTHNLGVREARRGQLAAASGHFSEAAQLLSAAGDLVSHSHALIDQSYLFLDAGLLEEAAESARRSLAMFEQLDSGRRCADAMLIQSKALVAQGEWRAASKLASAALRRAPTSIGDRAAMLANQLILSSEIVGDAQDAPPDSDRLQQVANADADLAVDVAVTLTGQGRSAEATAVLRPLVASPPGASALVRLHHLVASAVLALLERRHDDARRNVRLGLELAGLSAMALGVSDLRAMTERRVRQLRDCGVELEYEAGTAGGIVEVLELARAVVLTPEPDLSSEELVLLTQIRSLAKSIFERSFGGSTSLALTERRNRLERELRDIRRSRVLEVARPGPQAHTAAAQAGEVTAHLFTHQGALHAVIRNGGVESKLIELGDAARIRRTLTAIRLTLASLAGAANGPDPSALLASLRTQLGPLLAKFAGNATVAVVPEPSMGHIPWPLLIDTPIATGPSQRLLAASRQPVTGTTRRGVVAIAGPDLVHASREAAAVADAYPDSLVLGGGAALTEEVTGHFTTARLVHFASHGTFRADNLLYSSLRLEDGPLTLFDLLSGDAPEVVVFSSCDVGRSAASSSLGLASLLLTRGCRAVVASTGPVNDEAAADLMALMHRHHGAGQSMVSSLRAAQEELIPVNASVALFAAYGFG